MRLSTTTDSIPFPNQYGMWDIQENLRDAAYLGDLKKIKATFKQYPNLDPDAVDEYGQTALYIACKKNQEAVVNYLLAEVKANPNKQTIHGNSPILIATWKKLNNLVEKLLKHGGDASLRTNADREYHGNVSALDIAQEQGNNELVEMLKNHLGKEITRQPKP